MKKITLLIVITIGLLACGGGGDSSESSNTAPTYTLDLGFQRVTTTIPYPFIVTARVLENGQPKTGLANTINITLGRGSRGPVTETSPGNYQFMVNPTQTGEHSVAVSYQNVSITRTPLVFESVHPDWGQPMAVEGLVNTDGYEDGLTVTPNGDYLFVQYGPIYFSGMHLFPLARANGGCGGDRLVPTRCTHPWIDETKGPYTAPERPGFFGGRFSGTTQLHNANSWGIGIEGAPIFAPSTMFYGFKRQPDGSYAEPFWVAFEDENDAIINPYGMSFIINTDGSLTMTFTFNDPTDPDLVDINSDGSVLVESGFDVYTSNFMPGQNHTLGTFVYSGTPGTPPVRGSSLNSTLVDFGKTGTNGINGTQGNSHIYQSGGVIQSIWTDDEYDSDSDKGDISAYVLTSGSFPAGTWDKSILPTPVNQPLPSDESQPFFTGNELFYTHSSTSELPEVFYSKYTGAHSSVAFETPGNWTAPVKILGIGSVDSVGKILAAGEPTIAVINNEQYLYFIYGYIRGYDSVSGLWDVNMQAGYVKKN